MGTNNSKKISVFLPIYNEAGILEDNSRVIEKYLSGLGLDDYEVLLVENGSTDGSGKIAEKLGDEAHFRAIRLKEKSWGEAFITALRESKYDPVLFSIDLTFDLGFLKDILPHIGKYDLILGSRRMQEGQHVRSSSIRKIISNTHVRFVRFMFRADVTDFDSPKYFELGLARRLSKIARSRSPFTETELILSAKKLGYSLIEIPIVLYEKERHSSFNFFNLVLPFLKDFFKYYLYLITLKDESGK